MQHEPPRTNQELSEENALLKLRIRELERSGKEIQWMENKYRQQHELLMAIGRTNDLQECLSVCLSSALTISEMDCGGIYLADEATGSFHLSRQTGLSEAFVSRSKTAGPESPHVRLLHSGLPTYIRHNDLTAHGRNLHEGLRALAVIPVRHQGKTIAALNIASHALDETPREVRPFLESLALQMGGVLARTIMAKTLRESDKLYTSMIETIPDAIIRTDLNGKIIFVNDNALRIGGYSRAELKDRNMLTFIAPEDRERLLQNTSLMMEQRLDPKEYRAILKDGHSILFEVNGDVLRNADGTPFGFVFVCRDIRERKKAEKALRENDERLRGITASMPGVVFQFHAGADGEYGLSYISERVKEIFGFQEEVSTLFSRFLSRIHEEDREDFLASIGKAVETRSPWEFEGRFVKPFGEVIWFHGLSTPTSHDEQLVFSGIFLDITDRKRAEEALKKSDGMLHLITENMSDMIRVTDLQGNNLYVSPSHLKGIGYRLEERIGRSGFDIVHPDDIETILNKFEAGRTGNQPVRIEYRVRHEDGHYVWLETVADLLRNDQGNPTTVVMCSRDISDQKRAEEAQQKSEERYRSLVENANEAIMVIQDGMAKFINGQAVASFGYSEREFMSIPMVELIHPEDRDEARERYLRKIGGEKTPTRHSYRMIHKSGQTRWIESSSVLIDWEGRPATLNLVNDITESRRAEEERRSLAERLQRAEKMEALGQLAGGVAHDLNNVLGILSGYSELLLMEIPEGQKSRGHVEKILQSTEKGAAIIQDLLTLARRGVTAADVINLNGVVTSFFKAPMFEKMKDQHPRVTFRVECDGKLLNIKGSSVHLEKTLMNLVSNAAESISGEGEVTVRTRNCYLDKAIRGYDEIREGDYAVLTVSDTGMGIPAESKNKIFEPFYTKKKMGRSGTGLGLTIVWGTVKDHRGYIDIQTMVGEGTTFTLYFPVTREELTAPQRKEPLERYMGNGESALVVDDIAEQRDVASGLLSQLGYRVHAVPGGEEAVEYLKGNRADILVLDMIMAPGIDGLETYQRILEINPNQKAILVSGFSETDRVRQAQKLGAGAYVKKPYVMERIGVAIRNELNRKPAFDQSV